MSTRIQMFIAALFLASCSDSSPVTPVRLTDFTSGGQAPLLHSIDADFDSLGRALPGGFGGLFVQDEKTVVVLRDIRLEGEVSDALAPYLLEHHFPASIEVKQGDFEFVQLLAWRRLLDDQHYKIPGILSTDVQESTNRIEIAVETENGANVLRSLALTLGIPSNAINVLIRPHPILLSDIRDYIRPVIGGLQMGALPGGTCTLGFNVKRPDWHVDAGKRYVLTASHCSSSTFALDSGTYHQPFYNGQYQIAREVSDPTPFTSGCAWATPCRASDVSLLEYDDSVSSTFGRVARPENESGSRVMDSTSPTFHVTYTYGFPGWGWTLHKVGRSSGLTSGSVTATCTSQFSQNGVEMTCQDVVAGVAIPGDSGSPVFYIEANGDISAIGIAWLQISASPPSYAFSNLSNITSEHGPLFAN